MCVPGFFGDGIIDTFVRLFHFGSAVDDETWLIRFVGSREGKSIQEVDFFPLEFFL